MTTFIQPAPTAPTTKPNTRIIFVLDESGSMHQIKNDTIGGFNQYVDDQKNDEGRVRFSLVMFSSASWARPIEECIKTTRSYYDRDISQVTHLTTASFAPSGGTALFDTIGVTVSRLLAEQEDPSEQTIITILTDGEELDSREYTYQAVQNLITEAQDKRGWKVFFIGAGLNSKSVAASMGIATANSFTYGDAHGKATSKGIGDAMLSASIGSTMYRATSRGVDLGSLAGSLGNQGYAAAGEVSMDTVFADVAADATGLKARIDNFKASKKSTDQK